MRVINVANVNQALQWAVGMMINESENWIEIAPRGAMTKEWPTPVATVYARPWQRVLFSPLRDANPFFHLMESLWMLAGQADAEWISQFSGQIAQYAEDDGYFHGAYGRRWRDHFPDLRIKEPMDQLSHVARLLREDPNSRRAVLTMWDPTYDLDTDKKDLPCNTQVYFKLRDGRLNMLVTCRSNDIILGCYGANAVHFSVLQEYMAAKLGCGIGVYTHISDSWHYYLSNPFAQAVTRGERLDRRDYYYSGGAPVQTRAIGLVNVGAEQWDRDLSYFMSPKWDDMTVYKDVFFSRVAYPMRDAWACYKRGDLDAALVVAAIILAPDWRAACVEWLKRRKSKKESV